MKIVDAVIQILKERGPLTGREIYAEICAKELYKFGSKDGFGVMMTQIRRHQVGSKLAAGKGKHLFERQRDKYHLV